MDDSSVPVCGSIVEGRDIGHCSRIYLCTGLVQSILQYMYILCVRERVCVCVCVF